jgi:hypothetical protein
MPTRHSFTRCSGPDHPPRDMGILARLLFQHPAALFIQSQTSAHEDLRLLTGATLSRISEHV